MPSESLEHDDNSGAGSSKNGPHEIFISYAHADNTPQPGETMGWVEALYKEILDDHRKYSTEPLRIFFDTEAIKDMDDWEHRILKGLRHSQILLVCLSPSYFDSEFCRREWEEYTRRQHKLQMGNDSIASIYFVEVPGNHPVMQSDEAKEWLTAVQKSQYTDLKPWYPKGIEALRDDAVKKRMASLGNSLWERIQRARRATRAPGNMRRLNPYFVGRRTELRLLHENLAHGTIGVVTAVHGLGGQGKTELALAYAYSWASSYPGGLWILQAEGHKELLPLIGELAETPELEIPRRADQEETPDQRGKRVLMELLRRSRAAKETDPTAEASCLVVLDNVSEPELLAQPQISLLPRDSSDWLRVIATTRMGEDSLGASRRESLAFVEVGSLDEESALKLMREHQEREQWATPEDEDAAIGIVRHLGCYTLAVEAAAIYLGLNPHHRPADFLKSLQRGSLTTDSIVENDNRVAMQMEHQAKLLSSVLSATLENLSPVERSALDFASLLPPDSILTRMLEVLVQQEHPDAWGQEQDQGDPWISVLRKLLGLRLLTLSEDDGIVRMHRLVGTYLRQLMPPEVLSQRKALLLEQTYLAATAMSEEEADGSSWRWLQHPLQKIAQLYWNEWAGEDFGWVCLRVGITKMTHDQLVTAEEFLFHAEKIFRNLLEYNPQLDGAARALTISLNKLCDFLMMRGGPNDMDQTLRYAEESLEICQRLHKKEPNSEWAVSNLSISLNNLGHFLMTRGGPGDADQAGNYFDQSLIICRRLYEDNPNSEQAVRDLSTSLNNLGDFLVTRGGPTDADQARSCIEESVAIWRRQRESSPDSALAVRGLSASLGKLGDFLMEYGGPEEMGQARSCIEESLVIFRQRHEDNPYSALTARDYSVSLEKFGKFLMTRGGPGDMEQAIGCIEDSVAIRRWLHENSPDSALTARDLSTFLYELGDFLMARRGPGDMDQARRCIEESLEIFRRLHENNPESAQAARDLSIPLNKLADFLMRRGNPEDADHALCYVEESLTIFQRLHENNPESAQAVRDLSISLEKFSTFLMRRGNPEDMNKARHYTAKSLKIFRRLIENDPNSAYAARDLSIFLNQLGNFLMSCGTPTDIDQALQCVEESLAIKRVLHEHSLNSVKTASDLSFALNTLGNFLKTRGGPGDADKALHCREEALEICRYLHGKNPDSLNAATDLSIALNWLGSFLMTRGGPGDADKAQYYLGESIETCRCLLRKNPNCLTAARNLAFALNWLSDFPMELGVHGDADQSLHYIEESLEICQGLHENTPDDTVAANDFALALDRLGDILKARGGPRDADKAQHCLEESLNIRRRLYNNSPDATTAAGNLSSTLNKLGDFLITRGGPGDADQARHYLEESLDVCRHIYGENSNSIRVARDISYALDRLGDFLMAHGGPGDADQARYCREESVIVRKLLFERDPDSTLAATGLCISLDKLSDFLITREVQGDRDQALRYAEESVAIRRRLFEGNIDSAHAATDLSISLDRLGDFLMARGGPKDMDHAVHCIEESLGICRGLHEKSPNSTDAADNFSVSLRKLGAFLMARRGPKDAERARCCIEESVTIGRRILENNRNSAQAAISLSISLDKLGDFLVKHGSSKEVDKTRYCLEESLAIRRRIFECNHYSAQTARNLSISIDKLGDFLMTLGDPASADQARRYIEESLAIRRQLHNNDYSSAQAARDLSISLNKFANHLKASGRSEEADLARRYFEESLNICRWLYENNPDSTQTTRDFSFALENFGDFLISHDDPNGIGQARCCREKSLEICRQRHKKNPDSAQASRDLSVALGKLGNFLMAHGSSTDMDQAVRCYDESLEICRRLHANTPDSAQAASTLFYVLYNAAQCYHKAGQLGKAGEIWSSINPLLMDMEERGFDFDNTMNKDLLAFKARLRRTLVIAASLGIILLAGIGYAIWRMF